MSDNDTNKTKLKKKSLKNILSIEEKAKLIEQMLDEDETESLDESNLFFNILRDRTVLYRQIIDLENINQLILRLFLICLVSFSVYGFTMGIRHSVLQAVSSMIKLPVLVFLTSLICFPSMYMFNMFFGSKIHFRQYLCLILLGYSMASIIMLSFMPVNFFFMMIGSGYGFVIFLHFSVLILAMISGIIVILKGIYFVSNRMEVYSRQSIHVILIWGLIFLFVGVQMGYNMKPFLGDKGREFSLFRHPRTNIYQFIGNSIVNLIDD